MIISATVKAWFHYNNLGRGQLRLTHNGAPLMNFLARTGSVGHDGKLKNSIPVQPWYLCTGPERPVESEEYAMYIPTEIGFGWKHRLWPIPVPAGHERMGGYLIHPDGRLPGTMGCIGTVGSNAMEWFYWMDTWFTDHNEIIIPLEVKVI